MYRMSSGEILFRHKLACVKDVMTIQTHLIPEVLLPVPVLVVRDSATKYNYMPSNTYLSLKWLHSQLIQQPTSFCS